MPTLVLFPLGLPPPPVVPLLLQAAATRATIAPTAIRRATRLMPLPFHSEVPFPTHEVDEVPAHEPCQGPPTPVLSWMDARKIKPGSASGYHTRRHGAHRRRPPLGPAPPHAAARRLHAS